MEDDEAYKQDQEKEFSNSSSYDSNIFKPIGFRRLIQDGSGLDGLLLAYNGYFLPGISFVLWLVFLVIR
jgi:hypothetical protein